MSIRPLLSRAPVNRCHFAVAVVLATLLFARFAGAQAVYTWGGGATSASTSSSWETAGNWINSVTGASNGTFFAGLRVYNAANGPLIYDGSLGNTVYANSSGRGLVIGSGGFGNGAMQITGGTFSTAGSITPDVFGNSGNTGILTLAGGCFVSGTLDLNLSSSSTGALTINSGSAIVNSLVAGYDNLTEGSAVVNLNGGTLTTLGVSNSGSPASFNFNGGTLVAGGNSTAFLSGSGLTANVKSGGAFINPSG